MPSAADLETGKQVHETGARNIGVSILRMSWCRHMAAAIQTRASTAADFLLIHPSSPVAAVTHGSMPCRSLPGQIRHVTMAIQTHACSGRAS